MRCNKCSAPLPEGTKICNACGAALSPEVSKMTGTQLRKATQKELMFIRERVSGVAYEIGRLYKCRWGLLILDLICIVMSIWFCVVGESYWDYPDIYQDHAWYVFLTIARYITTIIFMIGILGALNALKDYLRRFRVVFFSILSYLCLSIVGIFVQNVLVCLIIEFLKVGATFCYLYNLYGSMEDLTRKLFGKLVGQWLDAGELSGKWRRLRRFYVVTFLLQVILMIISSIGMYEGGSLTVLDLTALLSLIGSVALLVIYIIDIILFKETWNSLERMEYSRVNRKI